MKVLRRWLRLGRENPRSEAGNHAATRKLQSIHAALQHPNVLETAAGQRPSRQELRADAFYASNPVHLHCALRYCSRLVRALQQIDALLRK